MKLSIRQKGLFIAGIPLLFELFFVGMLMVELAQARKEAQAEAHAVAIVGELNDIRGRIEEAYSALVRYKNSKNDELLDKYDTSLSGIQESLGKLQQLTKSDKFDRREVDKLTVVSDKTLSLLKTCKQNLINGNDFANLTEVARLFNGLNSVKTAMDSLSTKYHGATRIQSLGERERSQRFECTIYVGVGLNIFAAILIAVFVSRNITGRLQTLKENSRRLAVEQPLLPAMRAEDEISELDHDFRSMAQQLNSAQLSLRTMTEEARAGEANIRSIIENMPVGMLLVSEHDLIELANPALEKMLGYTSEGFKDKSLADVLPQFGIQLKTIASAALRQGTVGNESIALNLSGSTLHVETSIKEFLRSGTSKKQSIVVIQDVTQRHEMERLKKEFVAMVSHELRAPLNAVLTILELIVDGVYGEISETGQKRIATAVVNVDRLIGLINDLLDIEKMEAGKLSLELKAIDLEVLVDQSIDSMRTLAESRQIDIQQNLVEAHAIGDKDRLMQVLVNLLSNAIKFSDPGKKIIVELEKLADKAEIRVIDSGRGIPASALERLFQRFQQVHAPETSGFKGTGLGLAISRAIVEQHKGEIGVRSVEGQGSTFFFRIPLNNC